MNKTKTYIGILAVIPLLLIVASPSLLIPSEAQYGSNVSTFDGGSIQTTYQYGIRTNTIVCGDHLCNASKTVSAVNPEMVQQQVTTAPEHMPTLEIKSAHNYLKHEPNAYMVTVKVKAGDTDLKNVVINVKSDVSNNGGIITSLFATDDTVLVVRITAMDPASIHASINGFHLRGALDR